MRPRTILIATEQLDFHADPIIIRLRELGHNPVRLDPRDVPTDVQLSVEIGPSGLSGRFVTPNRTIHFGDIHAVWWRRPGRNHFKNMGYSRQERIFAAGETQHVLKGIWSTLDCYWMSSPSALANAEDKVNQLQVAAKLGFEIPNTLFTVEPNKALDFFDRCKGDVIYKTITSPTLAIEKLGPGGVLAKNPMITYTNRISRQMLNKHLNKIASAPCQFQQHIPKKAEYRVTVIGDEVFAACIDSQGNSRTKTDWRHFDVPMKIKKARLPKRIAEMCLAYTSHYDLNFGAFDLIETPDGRYVFLECNPNGQWMFVEQEVPELKMSEKLVSCLVHGRRGPKHSG